MRTARTVRRLFLNNFSTLNKNQMKQFDLISEWWHPSGPMHILYKYNYERVRFLNNYIKNQGKSDLLKPLSNLAILDVGCGAGFLTKSLTRLGANVTGLDPNSSSFKEAVEHKAKFGKQLENLKYFNKTLEQYLQEENNEVKQFDVVTSMDVIEHVDNPRAFISHISRAVKPEGLVMVSTIAKNPVTWLTHIFLAEYITKIVPKETHSYEKFINPNDLQEMLLSEGIQIVDRLQLDLNWRGEFQRKSGGGNYILLGRKVGSALQKVDR